MADKENAVYLLYTVFENIPVPEKIKTIFFARKTAEYGE